MAGTPKVRQDLVDLRAGVDDEGNIIAWESEFFVPEDGLAPVPLIAATLTGEFAGPDNGALPLQQPQLHDLQLGDSLHVPKHQDCSTFPRQGAIPLVFDLVARSPAKHFRQRMLRR